MGSDQAEEVPIPVRPQSPFVSNLRMQVAISREPAPRQYEHQPSVGTWLSPRSPRLDRPAVNFAAESEVVPITHRDAAKVERVLLELNVKGTCAKAFKLESVDAALTVRNVKELCEAKCSLPPDQQRLLFKGVILQDSQCLKDTNMSDRATLFLVKGPAPVKEDQERVPSAAACSDDTDELSEARINSGAILCIECGVNPGRLLTDGLCSICFRELVMRENAQLKRKKEKAKREAEESKRLGEERKKEEEELEAKRQKNTTRCYKCSKKTGLMGFECKCGYFFCASHRHAEDHDCDFDHKAHGRQILAQQNPKVETNASFE